VDLHGIRCELACVEPKILRHGAGWTAWAMLEAWFARPRLSIGEIEPRARRLLRMPRPKANAFAPGPVEAC